MCDGLAFTLRILLAFAFEAHGVQVVSEVAVLGDSGLITAAGAFRADMRNQMVCKLNLVHAFSPFSKVSIISINAA